MSQLIWDAFFIGNPTNFTLLYIVTTLTIFTPELLLQIQSYFHVTIATNLTIFTPYICIIYYVETR